MVKISIIVPVYNTEKYLKNCLESILRQSLDDFEIICINDGSEDKSKEILEEYQKKDSRIKIINQENKGQGAARNEGIRVSCGKYLCFVDPDDCLIEGALQKMYDKAEKENLDILDSDYIVRHENENKEKPALSLKKIKRTGGFNPIKSVYSYKDFKKSPFSGFRVTVWAKLYRSEFIKENKILFLNSKMSEDHPFSYKALFLAKRTGFLNSPVYCYSVRNNSALDLKSDINFSIFEAVESVRKILIEAGIFTKYEKYFEEYKLKMLLDHYLRVPSSSKERFKNEALKILGGNGSKFLKFNNSAPKSFIERIFSVKNVKIEGKKHKELTVLFFTFKLN
ncbi:MAG: glycosyltransferase [bacterium]|nr:glycosyltransferase [bacterium]